MSTFEIADVVVRLDYVVCCVATMESRLVRPADEELTAFVQLEPATCACGEFT